MILTIDPPLPCGTSRGEGICGKAAAVAHVDPGTWPGYYLLLPVCSDCASSREQVYGGDEHKNAGENGS